MRRYKSAGSSRNEVGAVGGADRYRRRPESRDSGGGGVHPGIEGQEPDEKTLQKAVEAAAVRLLARREHSVEELGRKLQAKGHPVEAIEAVLARLQAKRLVSNDRFASSFVHHHIQRGQGPIRIRAELRQQGIADEAIDGRLDGTEVDWVAQALAVRQRKFGAAPPRTLTERAKQARFLQYRGFSSDQIRAALKSDGESYGSDMDADAGLDPDCR